MNIFQFKHVGKGLFYAGSINDDINFVYDCGTAYSQEFLNDEIFALNNIFNSRKIDFVVISNLNSAYFSGLPLLCKNFKVNKIYLPYLGKNKDFIRLAIIDSIFSVAEDYKIEENLQLYVFMCGLYGIDSRIKTHYDFKMPKNVIILGNSDQGVENITFSNTAEIRSFEEWKNNPLWKFHIINKSLKKESFDKITEKFFNTYRNFNHANTGFDGKSFEMYLLAQTKKNESIGQLHAKFKKIVRNAKNEIELSSNILVHYSKKLFDKTYISEYKNVCDNCLQPVQEMIDGTITVLLGDVLIDKELEEKIFNCGNFSYNGGILHIPYNIVTDDRTDLISLARPFKTFVSTVCEGAVNRVYTREVIKKVIFPKKPLYFVTQSTGVFYFIR